MPAMSRSDRRMVILELARRALGAQLEHWNAAMNRPKASQHDRDSALSNALDFQKLVHDVNEWLTDIIAEQKKGAVLVNLADALQSSHDGMRRAVAANLSNCTALIHDLASEPCVCSAPSAGCMPCRARHVLDEGKRLVAESESLDDQPSGMLP